MKRNITISVDEKAIPQIDAAAKKEGRSRSQYLEYYGLQQARKQGEK